MKHPKREYDNLPLKREKREMQGYFESITDQRQPWKQIISYFK
jgi:hypothetical protein